MMMVILVLCVQYTACVGLHHSHLKRTSLLLLRDSRNARLIARLSSVLILVLSAILVFKLQGVERGIATWLALITLTGLLSLFTSAYFPKLHLKSAGATLIVAVIVGLMPLIF